MHTVWVLGAPDPEMQLIEDFLRSQKEEVAYATCDGRRVHPGNAYRADGRRDGLSYVRKAILVECDGEGLRTHLEDAEIITVDHHRPGDPGYGRPPAEFFAASSIGQVLAIWYGRRYGYESRSAEIRPPTEEDSPFIYRFPSGAARCSCPGCGVVTTGLAGPMGWHIAVFYADDDPHPSDFFEVGTEGIYLTAPFLPVSFLYAAAADHCLAAAYAGECPGVDPDALMEWRVSTRAAFQGRPESEILADIEAARKILRGKGPLVDVRGQHIPELPEAAVREGIAYLALVEERDGRQKETIGGATTPDMVRAFMESAKAEGREVYGDPARGFAGAYIDR